MTKLFQIITDSSCDLPQSLADELDLRVLPLHVTIDGKTYNNYLDGREIAFKDFFDKLRAGSQGTTSAVNPEEFRAEMEPVLAAGLDVLYVGFSSGLSTTYQSGCIAADELREILWLETGAVTPLALLNAPDVTLYLDEALLGSRIAVHPNTNTATVWLQTADLVSLLHTQCVPVVAVPFPCLA